MAELQDLDLTPRERRLLDILESRLLAILEKQFQEWKGELRDHIGAALMAFDAELIHAEVPDDHSDGDEEDDDDDDLKPRTDFAKGD